MGAASAGQLVGDSTKKGGIHGNEISWKNQLLENDHPRNRRVKNKGINLESGSKMVEHGTGPLYLRQVRRSMQDGVGKSSSAKWCCAKGGSLHGTTEDSISSISVSGCARMKNDWDGVSGLDSGLLLESLQLRVSKVRGEGVGFRSRRFEGARHESSRVSRGGTPSLVDIICRATWALRP